MTRYSLSENNESLVSHIGKQGSYKNCSHFSRTFQGAPARNIISQIVQKCTLTVYSYKALRFELFTSPTSLHDS